MRMVAWVSGLAAFAGLIVLSIAGVSSATAVLFTALAIVAMIALGNILGGRTTPNRAPRRDTGPDDRRGTMDE